MALQVDIVSAEGNVFSGEASSAVLPAKMGEMAVYPRHAPLLTDLEPGEVRLQDEEAETRMFYVSGGMLEIQPDRVTVLADTALRARDIDEAEAEQSKQRAEEAMQQASENVDYAKAQAQLAEALARIKILQKIRKNRA